MSEHVTFSTLTNQANGGLEAVFCVVDHGDGLFSDGVCKQSGSMSLEQMQENAKANALANEKRKASDY